jgi:acetyl esterase/lipase
LQARGRWFEPHPRPQLLTVRVPLLAGQSGQGEVDIVEAVGCAAVSVEWRRPPEHRFPAPMDDCYAGLKWAHANAAEFGLDPGRIAVGGASSGGGSAAGLALLARDRGEVPVCFQLPVYPVLDDRNVTPASRAVTEPKVWNRQPNLIGWQSYVGGAVGTDQVSP